MLTPNTQTSTYYKIGDYVTFKWNYTSLQITPSAINVIASCSLNEATWTLAQNMSVAPTGTYVWDTKNENPSKTTPLLTASYTLIIYDSDASVSDTMAEPGHLSSQNRFIFGMYLPQAYTPLGDNSKTTLLLLVLCVYLHTNYYQKLIVSPAIPLPG